VVAEAAEAMTLRVGLLVAQARKWQSMELETEAAIVYDVSLYEIEVF